MRRRALTWGAGAAAAVLLLATWQLATTSAVPGTASETVDLAGIHKIKHIVIIIQENRSFDSYFGTYPGADGIPMRDGRSVAA